MKIDLLERSQLEILNKRGPKYNLQDAEKDYFLAIILSIFYGSKLKDVLVFKGGTAIYHCYLGQIRFSKDLDFTATIKLKLHDIENLFSGFGIFKLKNAEEKKFGLAFSLQYRGILAQADTIEVDINTNQKVLLKPKIMEYKNYYGVKLLCPVMDKNEIIAEKIRTLNDRARPRDSYDLVILQKKLGLNIDEALVLLAKKEMYIPLNKKNITENIKISLERFDNEMEELYYREKITKEEIKGFSNELLEKIK
ncbi:MAG: nucleotidyl transferase AbiEii/AbiGii toxin family protein [Candidatus Omnitrophota bacterium]